MKENLISEIINKFKKYFDLKLEYYKLGIVEKIALLLGAFILFFIVSILTIILLILLVILLNQVLEVWIGIPWLVSLIEIVFVSICILILFIFKDKLIIRPVASTFIKILLKGKANEDNVDDKEKKE